MSIVFRILFRLRIGSRSLFSSAALRRAAIFASYFACFFISFVTTRAASICALHFLRCRRNERSAFRILGNDFIVLIALQHRGLGISVEQVNVFCIERKFNDILQFNGCTRRDLCDHLRSIVNDGILIRLILEIAIDLRFRTKFFDDIDTSLDDGIGRSGNERLILVNILGTDTKRDRLSGICIVCKILDLATIDLGRRILFPPLKLT